MSFVGNNTTAVLNLNKCGWPVRPPVPMRHPMRYLDLCSYPVLLLLCTVGNVISIVVLARDKSFGSKNIYLIAIAVADLLYMWNAMHSYLSNYDGEVHQRARPEVRSILDPIQGFGMFMQEASALANAWLIVAFTMERFLAIKHPLKHMKSSEGRRAIIIVVLIFALAAVTAMARLIDYYWFYNAFLALSEDKRPRSVPLRPPGIMALNNAYIVIMKGVQLGTFATIFTLNLYLIRIIIISGRLRRETLGATVSGSHGSRPSIDWGALSMLGACVILYLLTQSANFISNLRELLDRFCIMELDSGSRPVTAPIVNTLLNLSYTMNFFLYCGFNSKFRTSVLDVVSCSSPSSGSSTRRFSRQLSATNSTVLMPRGRPSVKASFHLIPMLHTQRARKGESYCKTDL